DHFGQSVSLRTDGTTIVAGAPNNPASGSQHGAAYIFAPTVTLNTVGIASRVPTNGLFVLTRDVAAGNLTVHFSLGGSAILSTDYLLTSSGVALNAGTNSIVMPAGTSVLSLTVTPVAGRPSGQSVQLTLQPDPGYFLGAPASASMTILPAVTVQASGN